MFVFQIYRASKPAKKKAKKDAGSDQEQDADPDEDFPLEEAIEAIAAAEASEASKKPKRWWIHVFTVWKIKIFSYLPIFETLDYLKWVSSKIWVAEKFIILTLYFLN